MKLVNDFINLITWLFSKNVFWSVNFALSFCQSHVTTSMTSSCVPIYQRVPLMYVSNWYRVNIFANSMFKRVITSFACTDVSDFKLKGVKMFLLNIWSQHQNVVKKFQASLKIWNKVKCTGGSWSCIFELSANVFESIYFKEFFTQLLKILVWICDRIISLFCLELQQKKMKIYNFLRWKLIMIL